MAASLSERLAEVEAETRDVFGAHHDRMASFIAQIGQTDRRPRPGDTAPTFALPTAEGRLVTLPALMGPRSLVLLFVRGLWCPYCSAQIAAFEDHADDFAAAGLTVVVITPEVGGRAGETKSRLCPSAEVLCDVDEGVALSYGCLVPVPEVDRTFLREVGYDLATLYGSDAWFMPLATTFLIDTAHRVAAAFGDADQRRRADPVAVLQAALTLPTGS